MKYWAPINSPGGIDGNDSYVNANTAAGVQGSIPTFQSFEQTLRGLQNLVIKSNLAPNASIDDLQVAESIRSQWMNWATTFGGTANALTCAMNIQPLALANIIGMPINGIAAATNTGAATLTVSGLLERSITRPSGAGLSAGDIVAGAILVLMYDGTKFQLVNYGMGAGGGVVDPWPPSLRGYFWASCNNLADVTYLGAGVWTKVNLHKEVADREGWYNPSNSRYNPKRAGFYYITGSSAFGSNSTLPTTAIRVLKNSADPYSLTEDNVQGTQYSTNGSASNAVMSGAIPMNGTTDYIEMIAFQDLADSYGLFNAVGANWSGWYIGS